MTQQVNSEQQFPRQEQSEQPGQEKEMTPIPVTDDPNYCPGAKLNNKVALITGGNSGIGHRGTSCAVGTVPGFR
jgi:hypothetical protein